MSAELKPPLSGNDSLGTSPPSPIKVLLIEDNPMDVRLIEMMIGQSNHKLFTVQHADRLATGLERLAAGEFSLVLLDLSLPDSHGLDTFTQVHAHAPKVPIIVMSGLDDETIAVNAVHKGAQDYLVKGHVDGHLLVRAMRYAIERKRTADQLARYAEELQARNRQMEADLEMAREIQQVFLPQEHLVFPPCATPEESTLRFCHRYQPAAAVGGDFFNILPLTDTTAGVFICDVMGHGMRAALVTAIMRGLVEELRPVAADPGKFLADINSSLYAILRRTDDPILSTAFYVIADVAQAELRFASAAHPSPLLVQRATGRVNPLSDGDPKHGPALGLFETPDFPICRCTLTPNDLLVLFTDGLYEVQNRDEEQFGRERLLAAVRQRAHLPPAKLFDQLLTETRQFASNREFDDDVCLVGVEVVRLRPGEKT